MPPKSTMKDHTRKRKRMDEERQSLESENHDPKRRDQAPGANQQPEYEGVLAETDGQQSSALPSSSRAILSAADVALYDRRNGKGKPRLLGHYIKSRQPIDEDAMADHDNGMHVPVELAPLLQKLRTAATDYLAGRVGTIFLGNRQYEFNIALNQWQAREKRDAEEAKETPHLPIIRAIRETSTGLLELTNKLLDGMQRIEERLSAIERRQDGDWHQPSLVNVRSGGSRGYEDDIPAGQDLAQEMNVTPLDERVAKHEKQIQELFSHQRDSNDRPQQYHRELEEKNREYRKNMHAGSFTRERELQFQFQKEQLKLYQSFGKRNKERLESEQGIQNLLDVSAEIKQEDRASGNNLGVD
ncbi:uncharacterized protein BP5553_06243 [Venustampulla echinocandica]|uniref:Uncharacterized protein n=1 Tax=Venustampulla echinocandica TaxID=2656787 RepID=A0A370TN00_9HELO|nr:uncharacterized protein BP5553_06243 [Venustampulla echinocandica]RDL36891.1 hypothetical protein BP5553_06243 [Venustampulla echinocandica]